MPGASEGNSDAKHLSLPGSASSSVTEAGWRVVAASVIGVSHGKVGLPCQDSHAWRVLPGGILIAAVADGAGSAPLAEVGSKCAADAAIEVANENADRILAAGNSGSEDNCAAELKLCLNAALSAVETEAEKRGAAVRDLATTLILVFAAPNWTAAIQVGDGAVVLRETDGSLLSLTTPPDAEYANETTFLTTPAATKTAQHGFHAGVGAQLALFSDGLQRLALLLPAGTPHSPFFAPLFRFAADSTDTVAADEQLTAFLTSPRITERADDDLTLLLATRI